VYLVGLVWRRTTDDGRLVPARLRPTSRFTKGEKHFGEFDDAMAIIVWQFAHQVVETPIIRTDKVAERTASSGRDGINFVAGRSVSVVEAS